MVSIAGSMVSLQFLSEIRRKYLNGALLRLVPRKTGVNRAETGIKFGFEIAFPRTRFEEERKEIPYRPTFLVFCTSFADFVPGYFSCIYRVSTFGKGIDFIYRAYGICSATFFLNS